MAEKVKDANLQEKEVQVVHGDIYADGFKDRLTGKPIVSGSVDTSKLATIHNYEEGTVLTTDILDEVKSGDIVKVNQLEFVVNNKVNQTPRSITGKCIGQIVGDSITIYELNWEVGEELEPITKKLDVSDEFDADITIQVATSGDSTFGDAITYEEWATKSKAKQYQAGTIIKFNNLYKGQSYRLIATDLTHGEGTEWQFYDMPIGRSQLGLPFDAQDFGDGGAAGLQGYLDGDDTYIYPSNMHGYQSAVELQNALNHIFESLPYKLKRDIRLTPVDCYVKRLYRSDDYGPIGDVSSGDYIKYDGEGEASLLYTRSYQHLYCLSAQEVGNDVSEGYSTDFPSRVEEMEWDDQAGEYVGTGNYVFVEGQTHDYFSAGNGSAATAKRIRYFEEEPMWYWLRSSCLSYSNSWGFVSDYGIVDSYAYYYFGVAPAFRV